MQVAREHNYVQVDIFYLANRRQNYTTIEILIEKKKTKRSKVQICS